jgi:hypothetical protein
MNRHSTAGQTILEAIQKGAQGLIACRLDFFLSVVANKSEAVEWVPCVAAVNGACCS